MLETNCFEIKTGHPFSAIQYDGTAECAERIISVHQVIDLRDRWKPGEWHTKGVFSWGIELGSYRDEKFREKFTFAWSNTKGAGLWKKSSDEIPGQGEQPPFQYKVIMYSPGWATCIVGIFSSLDENGKWSQYDQSADKFYDFPYIPEYWMYFPNKPVL